MTDWSDDLPAVEPRDPEPVAVAIETAGALFRSGERLEALRWLRRAAERAEESGDDVRAVHLARSAADLSTALQSVPPVASRRDDESVALSPEDDFSDKTVVDGTAPAVREALRSGVHISEMPASSQRSPHSATMPSPSSSEPTVTNGHFAPVAEVSKPAIRPAVRVAVTRDPENPGTWLVRPLPEGEGVPPGCEEALLIALDPMSKLLR